MMALKVCWSLYVTERPAGAGGEEEVVDVGGCRVDDVFDVGVVEEEPCGVVGVGVVGTARRRTGVVAGAFAPGVGEGED